MHAQPIAADNNVWLFIDEMMMVDEAGAVMGVEVDPVVGAGVDMVDASGDTEAVPDQTLMWTTATVRFRTSLRVESGLVASCCTR